MNGEHNLTYYHVIDDRITICIDYMNQHQKNVNISINLDEYYL